MGFTLNEVDKVEVLTLQDNFVDIASTDSTEPEIPVYIVPTHCTGRKAAMLIEKEMPEKFLLNMSGTKMIFAA